MSAQPPTADEPDAPDPAGRPGPPTPDASDPAGRPEPPTADALRAVFDAPAPLTIGLEEEVFLLAPDGPQLAPVAEVVLDRLGGDPRVKLELPAAQLELITRPHATVGDAIAELRAARDALTRAADGLARPMAAGVHPLEAAGALNTGPRYEAIERRYAGVARRQLVSALQVHVAVGGADRTLAVYNALRPYLAEIAAVAANAPYYAGEDTGCASVRPLVCTLLPRQGLPPAIPSWEAWAAELRWGAAAGVLTDPATWWFELRPHPSHGTLELRVPDAQATVDDAAAVAAYVHCLVAWLAGRHDEGRLRVATPSPDWRLQENRWLAARHGARAELADLYTGESRPVREIVAARLERLAPVADRLGCATDLARVLSLDGAGRQRSAGSPEAAVERLAADFAS